jgi:hypothetical protein
MDFEKLAAARYSVRAYKNDPVPDEILTGFSTPRATRRRRPTSSLSGLS